MTDSLSSSMMVSRPPMSIASPVSATVLQQQHPQCLLLPAWNYNGPHAKLTIKGNVNILWRHHFCQYRLLVRIQRQLFRPGCRIVASVRVQSSQHGIRLLFDFCLLIALGVSVLDEPSHEVVGRNLLRHRLARPILIQGYRASVRSGGGACPRPETRTP